MRTEEDTETTHDAQVVRLPELVLTIEEAARVLKIGRTKMCALLAAKEVDSVLIGRSRRVPIASIEEYVERLTKEKEGTANVA